MTTEYGTSDRSRFPPSSGSARTITTTPGSVTKKPTKSTTIPVKVSDADFRRIMVLGRGAYAKVVLCEDVRSKKRYAMKILNKHHVVARRQSEHTMSERHILACTSTHPFVVNLKFAYRTDTTLNLVMDYCPGGELFFHLSREGQFDETRSKFIAAELTLALGHLHAQGVVYRDLKPENILIDADGHIRLADFGLSKEGILNVASGAHTFCGTPEYLAPEILLRSGHGTAVDWWALGALIYEMLTGLPPWFNQNRKEMYHGILHGVLTFPPQVSPTARSIITLLLERDPTKRLGSRGGVLEVRAHEFFSDINWDDLFSKRVKAPWIPDLTAEGAFFDTTYTQQAVNSVVNTAGSALNNGLPLSQQHGAPHGLQSGANGQNVSNNNNNGNGNRSSLIHNGTAHFPDFAGFSWNAPMSYAPSPPAGEFFSAAGGGASLGKHQQQQQPDLELVEVRSRVGSENDDDDDQDDATRGRVAMGEDEDDDEGDDDEMEGFEGGAYPNFNGKLSSSTSSNTPYANKKTTTNIPSSSSTSRVLTKTHPSPSQYLRPAASENSTTTTKKNVSTTSIPDGSNDPDNNTNTNSRVKRRSDEEGLFDIDMEVGE